MQQSTPTRQDLNSLELRAKIKHLQGPQTIRFLTAVSFNYGCIALAVTLTLVALNFSMLAFVAALPLTLIIIAARQHALLVLMHDATHYLAHKNQLANDLLGDLLCGAPMGVKLATYRRDHLAHHQFTNTNSDPDWMRKLSSSAERRFWSFPINEPLWRFLARSWIGSIHYLLRSFSHLSATPAAGESEGRSSSSRASLIANQVKPYRTAMYLVLLATLLATNTFGWFLLFWAVPVFVFLPMIMRIRSIAEHFAVPNEHEFNNTRNVTAGAIERFFLAPHYVGLHLDHHLVASVPWHRLPELNRLLEAEPLYQEHRHANDGYFVGRQSLLSDMKGVSSPVRSAGTEHPTQSLA